MSASEPRNVLIAKRVEELHALLSTPDGVRSFESRFAPDWSGVIAAVENGCERKTVYHEMHKVIEAIAIELLEGEGL